MKPSAAESGVVLTADMITAELRDMILSGEIGLGVQLKQESLAKHFGVSRIPVREALKRLLAEGLVEHTPNAGSVVARKSPEELHEILDIRIGLETRALALAIPNMRPADFKAARDIIARYDASDEPREWAELNLEFHLRLYRPCGRPKLLRMIEEMVRGVDIHLRALQSSKTGRKAPQVEHRDILAACVERNVKKATALLQAHIEHTQSALAEQPRRPAFRIV
ncbi:MAG: GntR family transcriptional regulator [Lautropia sp.]